ncbi:MULTISPECIES: hypothetical protein [Halorussus]|uniref:hypothetical protein n=1 Tax=Halorussus TaxID=1070314 RepID=UPI0020A1D6F3|nr:hypothetical protein [Halorussus vallis]USZ74423.1 hypothetical protein NGM07_13320 [Halorussus vallis]
MSNVRVAMARGFSVAVVMLFLFIGVYTHTQGGFGGAGPLIYLLPLSFALVAALGIWYDRYRLAGVATAGLAVVGLLQAEVLLGFALLLAVAVLLAWTGRARETMSESAQS